MMLTLDSTVRELASPISDLAQSFALISLMAGGDANKLTLQGILAKVEAPRGSQNLPLAVRHRRNCVRRGYAARCTRHPACCDWADLLFVPCFRPPYDSMLPEVVPTTHDPPFKFTIKWLLRMIISFGVGPPPACGSAGSMKLRRFIRQWLSSMRVAAACSSV